MKVKIKPDGIPDSYLDSDEQEFMKPGTILEVMLHETDDSGNSYFLIKTPIVHYGVYSSEDDVKWGRSTRHYRNPKLPENYETGPYAWFEVDYFEVILISSNKEAKSLLEKYDWNLE